jgi:hypothetical protein
VLPGNPAAGGNCACEISAMGKIKIIIKNVLMVNVKMPPP